MDKVAEIRQRSELEQVVKVEPNTIFNLMADIRFLLSELERKDEEIQKLKEGYYCIPLIKELHETNQKLQVELERKDEKTDEITKLKNYFRDSKEKLREERDSWEWVARRVEEEKQSAQRENERLKEDVDQLHSVNVRVVAEAGKGFEKLIEGLRWYAQGDEKCYWTEYATVNDGGQRARAILQEIGVTVNE